MRFIIVCFILFFLRIDSYSQPTHVSSDPSYKIFVDTALVLLNEKRYADAAAFYEKAFLITDESFLSKFRAAIAYFNINELIKANKLLEKCASQNNEYLCDKNYSKEYISQLEPFHEKINWTVINKICEQKQKLLNDSLITVLKEIEYFDQGIRRSSLADSDYIQHPLYLKFRTPTKIDSFDLVRMEIIFQKFGYPGKNLVGTNLSHIGWLVIQHADMFVDKQEKYFPLIEGACKKGESNKYHIAYLTDRILVNRGKCQLYGTQVGMENGLPKVRSIKEFDTLNKRREEYELGPINDYLKQWGIQLTENDRCK